MIRRIAVLTGDDNAPGMNSVIRAVTRTALRHGWEVLGVCDGFTGLVDGEFIPLTARAVDTMIQWGSSMLGGSQDRRFAIETEQRQALKQLETNEIDALVIIGGHQTQLGALALSKLGYPVSGVAASVENEMAGFELTVGVDSAVNVALDSIDHVRLSHPEAGTVFCLEVAGRQCGCLTLLSGIAGNADLIIIPEIETTLEQIAVDAKTAAETNHAAPVLVIAEGAAYTVDQVKNALEAATTGGQKVQVTRLGYLQRRAAPNAFDRLLGVRLGACATDALARGEPGGLAGLRQGEAHMLPLADATSRRHNLDPEFIQLVNKLSFSHFVEAPTH